MLSDLQKKKFTHGFNMYDVTGDGLMGSDDFARFADSFAEIRGWETDSENYQRLDSVARVWWEQIEQFADSDGDGFVTLDEWIKYQEVSVDQIKQQGGRLDMIDQFCYMLFDLIDNDGDGEISVAEHAEFQKAWGFKEKDEEAVFKRLDLDGDGIMSREEALTLLYEFYLSSEIESPGNFFFGKFD